MPFVDGQYFVALMENQLTDIWTSTAKFLYVNSDSISSAIDITAVKYQTVNFSKAKLPMYMYKQKSAHACLVPFNGGKDQAFLSFSISLALTAAALLADR